MNAPEAVAQPAVATSQVSTSHASTSHLMTGAAYRESLRRLRPVVYVDGHRVESVADAPSLQPGVQALGVTPAAIKPE